MFSVPYATKVKIEVFDITGRKVAELIDENKSAGRHEVDFSARNLGSGIYFYQLSYAGHRLSRKMLVLK